MGLNSGYGIVVIFRGVGWPAPPMKSTVLFDRCTKAWTSSLDLNMLGS